MTKLQKTKIIFLMIILFGLFGFAKSSEAANWYVSKNGSNANGNSWSTAWNELNQINWNSVNPGDIVYVDGGTAGMSYGSINTGKGGAINSGITITRSEEPGHDGKVSFSGATINHPFITIDGKDKRKFEVYGAGGYIFRVQGTSDSFELKNIYIWGNAAGSFGVFIYVTSGSLTLRHVELSGQSAAEDQIKFPANGNLLIEDSEFHGWQSIAGSHSDFVEGCNNAGGPDCPQGNITIRRNIFYDAPYDCFMMSDSALGDVEISNNIFYGVADAFKFGTAMSLKNYNNIYVNCRELIGSSSALDCKNNIYIGQSHWNGSVNTCGTPQNSLWDIGALGFISGSGNIQTDPKLLDKNNLLGTDGEPFTNDDGYRLQADSPAINAGVNVGLTKDIMGNPLVDLPDIGVYEYSAGGGDTTPPSAPSGSSTHVTVSHCNLHGGETLIQIGGADYFIVEYSYFHDADAINSATWHPNILYIQYSNYGTFRYNKVKGIVVEGVFFTYGGETVHNALSKCA